MITPACQTCGQRSWLEGAFDTHYCDNCNQIVPTSMLFPNDGNAFHRCSECGFDWADADLTPNPRYNPPDLKPKPGESYDDWCPDCRTFAEQLAAASEGSSE